MFFNAVTSNVSKLATIGTRPIKFRNQTIGLQILLTSANNACSSYLSASLLEKPITFTKTALNPFLDTPSRPHQEDK